MLGVKCVALFVDNVVVQVKHYTGDVLRTGAGIGPGLGILVVILTSVVMFCARNLGGNFTTKLVQKHASVYVDKYEIPYGRMKMSHMIADTLDELHAMAKQLGLRRWFQKNTSIPHYDVCLSKRAEAVRLGAILLPKRPFVMKMREIRGREREKWLTG